MSFFTSRRHFIKMTALSGAGLGIGHMVPLIASATTQNMPGAMSRSSSNKKTFAPNRAASWWCALDDLQFPQKHVVDKIRRRADGFAKANIDTAINFGFHNRFDFANYFDRLHAYYARVCEELHQRDISFMDHYSCNHVTRPRNAADLVFVNKYERHAVLLITDPKAARFAQYEGHFYQDLCEVDLRDGSRGYAKQYQFEAFCHNNPGFHDMHGKYLKRLMEEVPFDAIEVDDMCSYPGNTTCGCKYCRERFKKDYGHDIPPFSDRSFFGDTSKDMLEWGNYDNPAYRDWLRMKSDSVRDHVILIKKVLGDKPLMTCCSDTGPIVLNAVALNLEKMAPYLDLFMLENVGTNIHNVDWVQMDAEALVQKDIAQKRGNAPAIALSYELSEKGAYLGWALARFWGVANWSSTLNGRLEEDPVDALEVEDAIGRSNNWEKQFSDLHYSEGEDVPEVRLVNNLYCRENGWRDENGREHWERAKAWSIQLVENNVGYRFVRAGELEDAALLLKENTPLVLDGVACVSDKQFSAIRSYVDKGYPLWLSLPFGTHDEKGFVRSRPLSESLTKRNRQNLLLLESAAVTKPLQKLILSGKFIPLIRQTSGDTRWVIRLRRYHGKPVMHVMNAGLKAIPDEVKDLSGIPLMKNIVSPISDNECVYEIDRRILLEKMSLMSPELNDAKRPVGASAASSGRTRIRLDLRGIEVYAVAQ